MGEEIIENPYKEAKKGKGLKVAKFLVSKGVDVVFTKKMLNGKAPKYVLSDADVEIRLIDTDYISELKNDYLRRSFKT